MSGYEKELLERIAVATESLLKIAELWEADRQEAINAKAMWNSSQDIMKIYTANKDRTTK